MGPPSPSVDAAWKDLLLGLNVRGTKEELIRGGENFTNIAQLTDGDYVIVPLVYHQIHCLDTFRRMQYIDYYRGIAGPDDDLSIPEGHFDHCLENLRKQVMCHADLSMLTGEWVKPSTEKDHIELRTMSKSKCVKWEPIESWARSRSLDRGKYSILAGPFGA
ncbi:uncharacterized protein LY89DRAFT_33966 [Mollisia scopiformis]|uniref:Uncharacterized protein n=1 Tax=Mollisia scopiformis TaxID=149040 RepID=A0A194XCS9_MOLSC|nr:uncharacterized protein LY89DRAFT_33966 [Mollisia scopiformis]KUJ17956.1 hypothetical protein LY89DRAFT_33966 [Mollisia scopiformis]